MLEGAAGTGAAISETRTVPPFVDVKPVLVGAIHNAEGQVAARQEYRHLVEERHRHGRYCRIVQVHELGKVSQGGA